MRSWLWPNAAPESRRVPFSTRTLFQILNAKDQQELRHRIAFWPAAFQPVALDLLTGPAVYWVLEKSVYSLIENVAAKRQSLLVNGKRQ
jgi:hypothetical protein